METPEQIIQCASRMDLVLSRESAQRMAEHLEMMEAANELFNLTSIPRADWLWAHLLDSLSCASDLAGCIPGAFADLGAGGGFPGIPLAIASGRHVTLVESVKKKAAFLEKVLMQLEIQGTVEPVRAEELAIRAPSSFAAVTARALSGLPSLVELAAPLLKQGGRLICLKGDPQADELTAGARAARMCGLELVESRRVAVPMTDARRTILTYESVRRPKVKLPRRSGMAQRQPLA